MVRFARCAQRPPCCKGSQAPADRVRMQRASQSHQPTFSAPKHSGQIPPLGMPDAGQGELSMRALLQHVWQAL